MEKEMLGPNRVTIELSCLQNNRITADLYLLLHNKFHNNYTLPEPIKEVIENDDTALVYLEKQGFIKITGHNTFNLRQRGAELFELGNLDKQWLEFLSMYPIKVPSNGGFRILKTADPDAKANVSLKLKYLFIIKDKPGLHSHIIEVLDAELAMRKKQNQLPYMQLIETWINQRSYEKYAYLLEEDKDVNYKNEDYM